MVYRVQAGVGFRRFGFKVVVVVDDLCRGQLNRGYPLAGTSPRRCRAAIRVKVLICSAQTTS